MGTEPRITPCLVDFSCRIVIPNLTPRICLAVPGLQHRKKRLVSSAFSDACLSRACLGKSSISGAYVKKSAPQKGVFLSHLYIKPNILPRQARDKHRENSRKGGCVSAPSRRQCLGREALPSLSSSAAACPQVTTPHAALWPTAARRNPFPSAKPRLARSLRSPPGR